MYSVSSSGFDQLFADVCRHAKGADAVVAKLLHFVGAFAAQHVHDVACAKVQIAGLLHTVNAARVADYTALLSLGKTNRI